MTNTHSVNPFNETRSQYSVFQVEIHTRRSMFEGFTWVLGTNIHGKMLGPGDLDPFKLLNPNGINNLIAQPYQGLDAVSISVNTHIDPSGKQSPNSAEVMLNEEVLVYAVRNFNKSSEQGFIDAALSHGESIGEVGEILNKTNPNVNPRFTKTRKEIITNEQSQAEDVLRLSENSEKKFKTYLEEQSQKYSFFNDINNPITDEQARDFKNDLGIIIAPNNLGVKTHKHSHAGTVLLNAFKTANPGLSSRDPEYNKELADFARRVYLSKKDSTISLFNQDKITSTGHPIEGAQEGSIKREGKIHDDQHNHDHEPGDSKANETGVEERIVVDSITRTSIQQKFSDETLDQKAGWMRLKRFIDTELEPDDRIVIKTLSHTMLPYVGDDWEKALIPVFTGYVTNVSTNGTVGSDQYVVLSCKDNLHYLEISKFNIAPNFGPYDLFDDLINSLLLPPSLDERPLELFTLDQFMGETLTQTLSEPITGIGNAFDPRGIFAKYPDFFTMPIRGANFSNTSAGQSFGAARTDHQHEGIDFGSENGAHAGTDIFASADGVVSAVVNNHPEAGNFIEVMHNLPDGTIVKTRYLHLQSPSSLSVGSNVSKGQTVVGKVGNTGVGTGPHLHFETVIVEKGNNFDSPTNPEIAQDESSTNSVGLSPSGYEVKNLFDVVEASDNFINNFPQFSATIGLNELINDNATNLLMRVLTSDAMETTPVLFLKNGEQEIKYYLKSGVTSEQLSYNNILGPYGQDNEALLPHRPSGPNGRIETILGIPFFNTFLEPNASINQPYGEWNTLLDICGSIASNVEAEFFADEHGRLVFKFPTHGANINLLPCNDIMPNIITYGNKVPYVIQDRNLIQWNYNSNPPVCTVVKASLGLGSTQLPEEKLLYQNSIIVRFDGSTTLGKYPIGGGENLIAKYGIRAEILPPTNVFLPSTLIDTPGGEGKLARSVLAQYAVMKGEIINDLARYNGQVTAIEDSIIRMGQPVVIESRLREGDFSDQFGMPRNDFYYVQGVTRNIQIGTVPTMTLNLTVGRRYPELSGFERAYFSFYQYIMRRYPGNNMIIYPETFYDPNMTDENRSGTFVDKLQENFGLQVPSAFFRLNEQGELEGPDKTTLNSITGTPYTLSNNLQTRVVTERSYADLETQVNELTKISNGWAVRIGPESKFIFARPSRKSYDENRPEVGSFSPVVEPLLKINLDKIRGLSPEEADIYPDPLPPVNEVPQQVTDNDILLRILNTRINIS